MEAAGRLMKAALLRTNRAGLVCPVTDARLGDPDATLAWTGGYCPRAATQCTKRAPKKSPFVKLGRSTVSATS
jgi:hypothetical protein